MAKKRKKSSSSCGCASGKKVTFKVSRCRGRKGQFTKSRATCKK